MVAESEAAVGEIHRNSKIKALRLLLWHFLHAPEKVPRPTKRPYGQVRLRIPLCLTLKLLYMIYLGQKVLQENIHPGQTQNFLTMKTTELVLRPRTANGSVLSGGGEFIKVWEATYVSKTRFDEKLAVEKTQLFGIMIGQMSEPSKDQIKETETGRVVFENKDPPILLKGRIQTHMSDSRLGAEQSLHKTQQVYNSL